MRNLTFFLFLPLLVRAETGKKSNSLSPQTLQVECPANVTISEGQKYDTSVTGFPKIIKNDGGTATITYLEVFSKGNCSNRNDLVTRIFTIRNAIGNTERCSQNIFISYLTPDQIRVPADTTLSYPKDKTLAQALTGINFLLGAVDISFVDTKISNMCSAPVKVMREWSFKDRCTNTVSKKKTVITITDYQNSFEQIKNVVSNLCDKEGEISLTPKGEFTPYSYQWNTGATTSYVAGLSAGNYSAVITDGFKCTQLNSTTLTNMSETGDVGGRIATQNSIRVYPDSIFIKDESNIEKFCVSLNGGLQYAMKLKKKNTGFMDYSFVKRSQVLDGLTTKDIVIIQKHILGKQPITDPLLLIAADVNANYSVASSDIAEIRKLLLGVIPTFAKVLPWYFYRQDWMNGGNPQFQGVSIASYPRLNADVLALKMADVDLSFREPGVVLQERDRSLDNKVYLEYRMRDCAGGTVVELYLHSMETGLAGFQGSWLIPGSDSDLKVLESQIPGSDLMLKDGELRISHSTGVELHWDQSRPMLTVQIGRKLTEEEKAEMLKRTISLDAEFYTSDLNAHELFIHKAVQGKENTFTIYPNPSTDHFVIHCAEVFKECELHIFDGQGRKVFQQKLRQTSTLVPTGTWANGTYYYRALVDNEPLASGFFIKTE